MAHERIQPDSFGGGPDPFSDGFETATATLTSGRVEVVYGVYSHSLPLAGLTVAQARAELEERLNLHPQAPANIDGFDASEDTVLHEGQILTFVQPAGEKG
ncbi:MAG: hypothetical protein FJ271_15760 [Planctomycetes bacterium]|nr:hypothetical protein [Planctomycetota bacterium]